MTFPLRYFISLSLIIVAFSVISWWLNQSMTTWPTPSFLPLTITVLYILTFSSHMFVRVSALSKGKPFVQLISMSMVLRITLYGLFALLIIIFSPGSPTADIIYFGILYLVLTIHEVIDIVINPFKNQEGESS